MLTTEKSVKNKIKSLESQGYIWKPLGGNPNNEGIIQLLTDPDAGITERITNAIDAVLEKYYVILESNALSPSKLADEIKVELGKEEIHDLITVTLYKSQNKNSEKSITLDITDRGIGIKGEDFENTILKLSGNNKLSKKYLMGAYGQGGSTSIKFNEYTVIYSKAENSKEAMTIIRYNIGSDDLKNGSYEYICFEKNGKSYFTETNVLKHEGTKIVNVSTYNKKIGSLNQHTNSLYASLNNRLFSPPLPFRIIDLRDKFLDGQQTIVEGAKRKLHMLITNKKYFGETVIKTKQGSNIIVRWWVIMPKNEVKKFKGAESYLKDSRLPFNFTMNGQTQGYLGAALLNEVELSFLKKRFICEIELTNISKQEKRSILSSSRENIAKDSDFWEELRSKITKYLFNSSKLQKINKEIREMMTSLVLDDKTFNKNLSKALKNLVSLFSKGHVRATREIDLIESLEIENDKQKDEVDLSMFPTYFNFIVSKPHEFSGDILKLRYKTNGLSDVILLNMKIETFSKNVNYTEKKQNGSIGVVTFDVKNMKMNDESTIKFDILDGAFVKNVLIKKIDPSIKKEKPGYPKTKIIFITKEKDGDYLRLDFNKQRPCKVEYSSITNILSIYLNMATYPYIGNYSKNEKMQKRFKEHYSMGLGLYIISQIQKDKYKNSEIDEDYDYNPIAKNLIWTFGNLEKLK